MLSTLKIRLCSTSFSKSHQNTEKGLTHTASNFKSRNVCDKEKNLLYIVLYFENRNQQKLNQAFFSWMSFLGASAAPPHDEIVNLTMTNKDDVLVEIIYSPLNSG